MNRLLALLERRHARKLARYHARQQRHDPPARYTGDSKVEATYHDGGRE